MPIPFLVYYVIGCILTDEVNNGGFAQYLSNSSVHGGDNVRKRIKRTKNTLICGLFLFFAVSINSNNEKYKIDEINTNYNRNNTIYYIYISNINSLYRTFYYI